jgi:methyl-accepting chemotaxis protein
MGLISIGLSLWPLTSAIKRNATAQQIVVLAQISRDLFDAIQSYRQERAYLIAGLAAETRINDAKQRMVAEARKLGEADYDRAMKAMMSLHIAGFADRISALQQAHQFVADLRPRVDREVALEKAGRDNGLTASLVQTSTKYLVALTAAGDLSDAAIELHDPLIDRWLTIKSIAWRARNAIGDQSSLAATALSAHRLLTENEHTTFAHADKDAQFSWQTLQELVGRPDTPASVHEAFVHANEALFGKNAADTQAVLDAFRNGRMPDMPPEAYLTRIIEENAKIKDIITLELNQIVSRAEGQAANAFAVVLLASLLLIVATLPAIFGFFIVSRRVSGPLVRLTQVMRRLADGDLAADIPISKRNDELGDMVKTVAIFRDNGLAMQRLEIEAETQRHAAEADRAQAAAEQAARVKQQQDVVAALAGGLARLAEGDLTTRLQQSFAEEYERLRTDFNAAMAGLQTTVQQIAQHTEAIRMGTQEIAASADDLSRRTERQAAGLEETAAALQEITGTVQRTADGSQQARNVARAAQQDASRSEQVVRDAVAAMSAIEGSAREIGQIIGVIDEIAFQTNLLALNAGVEAARAGESGRGFAVVASEVRALAQRSADAAKQIKRLVTNSAQQVDRGVALVGETGEALARILTQVGTISQVIGEIASSAQEQATGLIEVNTAVSEMDHVTQQNAAMVEQTTSATHSLAHETEALGRATGRFRIEPTPAAAGGRRAA